jgi:hypothetical protein
VNHGKCRNDSALDSPRGKPTSPLLGVEKARIVAGTDEISVGLHLVPRSAQIAPVTVPADTAECLTAEIRQILKELSLGELVNVERQL